MADRTKPFVEKIEITADQLRSQLMALVKDANAQKVIVKNASGRTLFGVPLTIGAAGAGLLFLTHPLVAGAAALGGAVMKLRLEVERTGPAKTDPTDPAGPPAEDPTSNI
ncbi:DUF4342 domain-containing protein [Ammonicoccus fulvus]|uniref:DUF4342 domain-containing protein n=1 Tax=Ammonicoccus fulvus TaxID=3138240 RepID=A0ABZ3FT95_9ACTN